jgi:poly(3-hydroxybutyrate) depolymerase
MVWQLMNSDLVASFQGFAAVAQALDPEKALQYREHLQGQPPVEVPAIYVHGTADRLFRSPATFLEFPLNITQPANTVLEMLMRNGVAPNAPSVTTLAPDSTNITEVVVQLFQGTKAFEYVTVIGGGHNWPGSPAATGLDAAGHFNATREIVEFWQAHASLPV